MSSKIKLHITRKITECLQKTTKVDPNELQSLLEIGKTKSEDFIEMRLPLMTPLLNPKNAKEILQIKPDSIIQNVTTSENSSISFKIDRNSFVQDFLENRTKPNLITKPKRIIIEYSSPNIAKPFHMGNFRSTIIGHFITNLNKYLNNRVTSLNYLGDWGTQFGFIRVGVDKLNYNSETIRANPLKLLYESYVYANKLGENDPRILEEAKNEFSKLEKGSIDDINCWREFVNYSKTALEATYNRLGINFDEYNYESMYSAENIQNIIEILTNKGIIEKEASGKLVAKVNDQKIAVVKSDGTTLYLTRDIAAAIDRFQKYNFDEMYYIVDSAQSDHFKALKQILLEMGYSWSDYLHHVKFGRVRGMSTRKGTAVFLSDILDEARDLMIKKQIQSPTTKVAITDNNVSDILGISCVIINDLKQRRQKDYEFSWDRVLQAQGDTGIKLQYTHCRLYSLEKNSGVLAAVESNPELLTEPETLALITELAKFHEILLKANEQLEACVLVTYLFHLCNHISKALKTLKVKGSSPELASQRLLLFQVARNTLAEGMNILGLKSLNEM